VAPDAPVGPVGPVLPFAETLMMSRKTLMRAFAKSSVTVIRTFAPFAKLMLAVVLTLMKLFSTLMPLPPIGPHFVV
jgi:hypothetical protein